MERAGGRGRSRASSSSSTPPSSPRTSSSCWTAATSRFCSPASSTRPCGSGTTAHRPSDGASPRTWSRSGTSPPRPSPTRPRACPAPPSSSPAPIMDVPPSLLWHLEHNKALHESLVVLTVETGADPLDRRGQERLGHRRRLAPHFWRARATYGFMERPDIPSLLREAAGQGCGARLRGRHLLRRPCHDHASRRRTRSAPMDGGHLRRHGAEREPRRGRAAPPARRDGGAGAAGLDLSLRRTRRQADPVAIPTGF